MFQKLRTARLAAAATVALMVGGTAAAAATGSLPTQSPSHRAELAASPAAATPVSSDDHGTEHHNGNKVFGTVASVDGVSDPGTCGVAGSDGTFTVDGYMDESWTVNVTADTEFSLKHSDDDASFADVCVDARVKAKGTFEDGALAATKVRVKDPSVHPVRHTRHERKGAFGQVASVNGVSDPGTCGTADTAGSFTVEGYKGETFTVDVDSSTAFAAKDVTDASFANVCVGLLAFAKGDVTDSMVTANAVFIVPPRTDDDDDGGEHEGAFGEVTSVNGVGDDDTCGTEGADGSFTVVDRDGNTTTVNVTAATQFFGKHHWDDDETTSFADVCVGQKAGARGERTDAVVAAEMVFVFDSHRGDRHHWGGWRRHGGKHDCDGRRHRGWDGDDHDGEDASFSSHRDDGHDRWNGKRRGGWDDDGDRHDDWSGKSRHGHDDD